jgi:hypothetical protein
MSNELQKGKLALDVAKQSVVEVLDTDMGTISEQDEAMRDLIYGADGNQACGVDADMQCVEVKYVGMDSSDRTYTMPVSRIKTSDDLVSTLRELSQEAGVPRTIHTELSKGEEMTLDEYTDDG